MIAHPPRISRAAQRRYPFATQVQTAAAISSRLLIATLRFRDTASAWHCSRTLHPGHTTQDSESLLRSLLPEQRVEILGRRESTRASGRRKKADSPVLETK